MDTTSKARWYHTSPSTQVLKMPFRDGGRVLATIRAFGAYNVHWFAGDRMGIATSEYAAQRAARKALREIENASE